MARSFPPTIVGNTTAPPPVLTRRIGDQPAGGCRFVAVKGRGSRQRRARQTE